MQITLIDGRSKQHSISITGITVKYYLHTTEKINDVFPLHTNSLFFCLIFFISYTVKGKGKETKLPTSAFIRTYRTFPADKH